MEVIKYFQAVKNNDIPALIQSHQDTIDWRKEQLKDFDSESKFITVKIIKESIQFNERAVMLLYGGDIINYSIEYAKLEIPTPPGKTAYYIAGQIKYNPKQPPWCQAQRLPTTIAVVIGNEDDVKIWIKENTDRLKGVYEVLEYQDQNAAWDDILGRVVI